MRRTRFFLDANVIVDAQCRDLLLRAAEAGMIEVLWSAEVLAESQRALARVIGDATRGERMIAAMRRPFPAAAVVGYEHVQASLQLPDPDDTHVLAAAVTGECDVLVTENLDDFPEAACEAFDLTAMGIDDALLLLVDEAGHELEAIVRAQVASLRRPSMTHADFIRRLSDRAPTAAMVMGAAMGLEEYRRMLTEVLRARSSAGPQQAVRDLLDALRAADAELVFRLIDSPLRRELGRGADGDARAVTAALALALADVLTTGGWGFATAWRPQSPDVELVKLVQAGDRPLVAQKPQVTRGHLFYMRSTPDGWLLTGLDGPDPGLSDS